MEFAASHGSYFTPVLFTPTPTTHHSELFGTGILGIYDLQVLWLRLLSSHRAIDERLYTLLSLQQARRETVPQQPSKAM